MATTETNIDNEVLNARFKTTPYKHQLDCLNRHGRKEAFALLAEMGTGKSWIVINNMADLWASADLDAAIVFAPNGVHSNWTRLELPKHMPDWTHYISAAWSSSPTKQEKQELDHLFDPPPDGKRRLKILTMNWEALQTKKGLGFAKKFALLHGRVMIVCDESDAVKNPKAARTKALMSLKPYTKWRRIMSGTPINNAPFDAFSQFTFLDEHILGTTSFYAFKAEYAEMLQEGNPLLARIKAKTGGRGTPQVVAKGAGGRPKYKNLDKLSALIAPYSFRVLKSECLDLPQKIYKTAVFRLTKEQIDVYKKAEDECRLVFQNEETPFNKLVAVTKLSQITSGYFMHPNSEEPVRIEGDNPKLDLLQQRVKAAVDSGEKVIVWARYRVEIRDIVERLKIEGLDVVEYHGGTSKEQRVEAIERFENGSAQVFVGNQQAGGTGITLVAASVVIYFSNNFSLRDRLQSEDRAHRIGQKKNVVYINLVAKGTIDESVVRALLSKKNVADEIIDKGMTMFGG